MKLLLDTHFLLWITLEVPRIDDFDWLDDYRPWGVSPVSFLEVAFLSEVGRIEADTERFMEAVGSDPRFTVDEVPLVALVRRSLPPAWTRDPFDRPLAAHSGARRSPLCTGPDDPEAPSAGGDRARAAAGAVRIRGHHTT